MKSKFVLLLGGVVVLIGIILAAYMYNKPHTDYQEADAKYTGQSVDFYNEATADQGHFLKLYLNKAVVISGKITSVESSTSVLLNPGILCQTSTTYDLNEGETIKLKGRVVGAEEDLLTGELLISLDQCELK